MSFKSKLKLPAWALSIGMVCSAQAAYNPQFYDVISFGDSLSDMGAMKDTILTIPGMEDEFKFILSNIFTTPEGKTASGHLASNYGNTSKAALKIKVANDQLPDLVFTAMKLQNAQGVSDFLDGDLIKAASTETQTTLQNLNQQLFTLTELPKSTENTQATKTLLAEAQRLALGTLVDTGIIKFVDADGNNFAVGGASASSTDNGATLPIRKEVNMSGQNIRIIANLPMMRPSLKDQVDRYLHKDGKADANTLYTITAGANDLFRARTVQGLIAANASTIDQKAAADKAAELTRQAAIDGTTNQAQASIQKAAKTAGQTAANQYVKANKHHVKDIIIKAAQDTALQTKRLVALGAKYVVVTNIPDVTDTPDYANKTEAEKAIAREAINGFNQMLQASLSSTPVIFTDIKGFLKTIKANPTKFGFDSELANTTFFKGNSQRGQASLKELTKVGADITIQITTDNNNATEAQKQVVAGIEATGITVNHDGTIIGKLTAAQAAALDKAGITSRVTLNRELSDEAKAELITNSKNYIFADGVHPSSAIHKYLADVVINGYLRAPGYNASMQALARSGQNELTELFEGRRTALVESSLIEGELRPYVNISGSKREGAEHDNLAKGKVDSFRLHAVMDYGISQETSGGLMLTVQRDQQDFTKDMYGKQEREAYIAGAYLNHQVTEHWTLGFNGYLGTVDYDQTRKYTLGNGTDTNVIVQVTNTGDTDSIMLGGSLGANGHYIMSDIDLMPRVNLNYQYEKIQGYTEKTDTEGAVKFDDATLKRTELALGLNLSKTFDVSGMALKPYADIDWRQQLAGDKEQTVKWKTAASTGAYIEQDIAETDRSFGTVKIGGQLEITEGLTTQLSYSKKFGSSLSNGDRIMLGVGYMF